MTTNSVSIAGELKLNKLYIVRGDEKAKIDITAMMLEIDLYEDIFSHTLSGSISLTENFNLIHDLPIIGEEIVEIEFLTPSVNKTFSKAFFLYKIGRRVMDGNSKNTYSLQIVSVEALIDLNTKISRAFTGMPGTIIEDIFKRYFKSDTKLEVDNTNNLVKFFSPYWSPFKCINYAASHAFDSDKFKTPSYLFYETNQKFKLKALHNLFNQKPVTEFFFDKNPARKLQDDGESTRNIDREYKTVENFEIIEAMDYIDRIMNGVYSFKVYDVNILNKTLGKHTYNYWDNFKETSHLGDSPQHSDNVYFDKENGRIEWAVTHPYMYDGIKKDYNAEIVSKRIPLLSQTEMFTVEITVPGRLGIEVGDVVLFHLMNYSTKKNEDKTKTDLDKYYSGKYLITSIEHRLTRTRHKMNISLMKESFANKVEFSKEI
jgi:hypothetical protein